MRLRVIFWTETRGLVTLPPEATVLFFSTVGLHARQEVCLHGNPCTVVLRLVCLSEGGGEWYVLKRVWSPQNGD